MKTTELISFGSAQELAQRVAADWLNEIKRRPDSTKFVALSGGRIAKTLFSETAEQAQARGISFRHIHFFWADERCVPPDDAESNFRVARELLFAPLQIPKEKIHRIHGEEPPESAAKQAQEEICRVAPLNPNGQPILDLIFLGMGEDGHVASLFPNEPEDATRSPAVYRPVTAIKPPPHRITLGYNSIIAGKQIWVLASGKGKETALRESLQAEGQTPLARILRAAPRAKVCSDIALS